MRRRLWNPAGFLGACALMFAWPLAAQQPGAPPPGVGSAVTGRSVPVQRFRDSNDAFSQYSGLADSLRVVIRDPTTWRQYWHAINRPLVPQPALPEIDFDREMIVLAALGARRSAGFSIRVEGATLDTGRLVVSIKRLVPGAACAVAAVVTQPVDVVRLPATAAPVWFTERQEVPSCER